MAYFPPAEYFTLILNVLNIRSSGETTMTRKEHNASETTLYRKACPQYFQYFTNPSRRCLPGDWSGPSSVKYRNRHILR